MTLIQPFEDMKNSESCLPLFDFLSDNGFDSRDCVFNWKLEGHLTGTFHRKFLDKFKFIFNKYETHVERHKPIKGFVKVTVKLV